MVYALNHSSGMRRVPFGKKESNESSSSHFLNRMSQLFLSMAKFLFVEALSFIF
jgi:hypothetical protein